MATRRKPSKKKGRRGKRASPLKRWVFGVLFAVLAVLGITGVQHYRAPLQDGDLERLGAAVLQDLELPELPALGTGSGSGESDLLIARVRRVVDGDTIVVEMSGREQRVRLLNVDTPESVHPDRDRNHPMGKEASRFTQRHLENRQVRLRIDPSETHDRYGRLLAVVQVEGEDFNERLIREGYSAYYTEYGKSPWFHGAYDKAEDEARKAGKGIWAPGMEELREQ